MNKAKLKLSGIDASLTTMQIADNSINHCTTPTAERFLLRSINIIDPFMLLENFLQAVIPTDGSIRPISKDLGLNCWAWAKSLLADGNDARE